MVTIVTFLRRQYLSGGVAKAKRGFAGCTSKGSIFAPRTPPQPQAIWQDVFPDLNDHFSSREYQKETKTMRIGTPLQTNELCPAKMLLAAAALALYKFCNPSNVLAWFWTKRPTWAGWISFLSRETSTFTPQPQKHEKHESASGPRSGPRQVPLRRSGVKSESESSIQSNVACCGCCGKTGLLHWGGANDHFSVKESPF